MTILMSRTWTGSSRSPSYQTRTSQTQFLYRMERMNRRYPLPTLTKCATCSHSLAPEASRYSLARETQESAAGACPTMVRTRPSYSRNSQPRVHMSHQWVVLATSNLKSQPTSPQAVLATYGPALCIRKSLSHPTLRRSAPRTQATSTPKDEVSPTSQRRATTTV